LNTFSLIDKSHLVITINSTVGLEALILEKNFEVLGRAFYKNFTQKHIEMYILNYLIDIDYFSNEDIELESIHTILERIQ